MTQSTIKHLKPLHAIPQDKFPKHIFIIPDGNGRWAMQKKLHVLEGHKKGAEVTKQILEDLMPVKEIETITIWGFSSDNWKRVTEEVSGIMSIISQKIDETLDTVKNTGRRFVHIGRKDRLPKRLLESILTAEKETRKNIHQTIALAIDFGGEDQNIRMITKAQKSPQQEITKDSLWQLRDTEGLIKAADLLIRTSGEKRTSDVGWLNGSQTELYFIDKFYPEITTADIIEAIVDFSKRERRMGGRK